MPRGAGNFFKKKFIVSQEFKFSSKIFIIKDDPSFGSFCFDAEPDSEGLKEVGKIIIHYLYVNTKCRKFFFAFLKAQGEPKGANALQQEQGFGKRLRFSNEFSPQKFLVLHLSGILSGLRREMTMNRSKTKKKTETSKTSKMSKEGAGKVEGKTTKSSTKKHFCYEATKVKSFPYKTLTK